MKKGVASTVAIIILLAMTISASGAAFYWLHLIQGKVAGNEQMEIEDYGPEESEILTVAAEYTSTTDKLIMFFENKGDIDIPVHNTSKVPTTIWLLKDVEQNLICTADWSGKNNGPVCIEGCDLAANPIAAGETKKIVLGNLGANTLCDITTIPKEHLLFFSIDFAGKAKTSGTFIR